MYVTFGQKTTCIRGFRPKTYMYMWLLAKNPRMYANFGQKPAYTEKTVVKSRPRVKPIKGSVNGWTYYKMQHKNKEKQRASQEYQAHYAPKPQRKTRNVPSGVTNYVMDRKFLWLGVYHNRQINHQNESFPICKRNQISNTKGSRIIPYSRWLKQIPVEIFPISLMLVIFSQQQQKRQACYIMWCYIYSSIYSQQCKSN